MSIESMTRKTGEIQSSSSETGGFSFDPDKRMDVESLKNEVNQSESFDPNKRMEIKETYFTTLEERIGCTPKSDCDYGKWTGERGQSKFIPSDGNGQEKLSAYGLDGINYKDGVPDFSKCADTTVRIDMTANRLSGGYGEQRVIGNFEKADTECAKQWNALLRDGRNDWTARDVYNWRKDNNYSWHECSDTRTCQLVPQDIHDVCLHPGGVMECQKRDAVIAFGGGFDE